MRLYSSFTFYPLIGLKPARLIWTYFNHRELDEALASGSPLNRRGFHKILALGLFDILLTFPSTLVNLLVDTVRDDGVATFWSGWRAAHSNFSSVSTSTSEEWKSVGFGVILGIKFGQWNYPAFAIMFFALFGLTENNRVWYRNIFWKMLKPFGFLPHLKPKSSAIAFGSGPVSDSGVLATMTT